MRVLPRLCAAVLTLLASPLIHAGEHAGLPVAIEVRHASRDVWRVDYRFAQAVTAIRLPTVDQYRQQAWKVLTPKLHLKTEGDADVVSADGKPFKTASIEIRTYTALPQKNYTSFNRFSDGGTAVFLGHLQGDVQQGKKTLEMRSEFRLEGLAQENVIAPPPNRLTAGGERGYAYFGPAQGAPAGKVKLLVDPETPQWLREAILETGEKVASYYEQAYQRSLKDDLLIMVSVAGYDKPGFSIKGGAVMGQVAYRLEGKQLIGDHPKKREYATLNVAHEMAHVWQMAIARGGMGADDPWIHEGGAEAMALDALLQSGVWSAATVNAYRDKQTAACDKLNHTVDTYDGIYACGLVRFDQLGVGIVPLWRSMMEATEVKGDVYSQQMIDAIVAAK